VSNGARSELFVYYRVAQSDVQAALTVVRTFQLRLREQHPGLATRLLWRSGERDTDVTLMEIYAFDQGGVRGVDATLRSRIEAAATVLTPLMVSARRIESFDSLD
jgi:Domain of unknown function (DUF4936)